MAQALINVALLALGAALGGMGRFAVTRLAQRLDSPFPWGTLWVNASGALAAGALLGHFGAKTLAESPHGLFLMGGLLGGYTTVSSLALQTRALWLSQRRLTATVNLGGTLVLGTALAALGWQLGGAAL
ncbi:CrcB family protein [Halomonas sp. HNIBRBA4712]|uniref:CrcB family protein n=1 Tax=Halomonas sp. HNIBRBA4712 TaxID=3373087 RepID=UPI003747026A